ncbi:kinase-like protein, partial [Rhizopus microsporus]
ELRHFYLQRVIGKGAFGKVRMVQHKIDRSEYALKYIKRVILELLDHPLIVNLRYAFQDDENLFMVLDLMLGGDLRFHLDTLGTFNELQVRFYVAQLILSISYIHSQHIIHRDIKPDNVLLDHKGHAHLSDFNIATQLTPQKPYRQNRAGSLAYMAPEILLKQKYTTDVDWWSLGITTFELLFGQRPFGGDSNEKVQESILHDPLQFPEKIQVSVECRQVIQGLLAKRPKDRLGHGREGLQKLKSHPWFQGLDWEQLESKKAQPPFIPNKDVPNYDAVHELEELLFEEEPLRVHPKSKDSTATMEINTKFLPYDHTKQGKATALESNNTSLIRRKIDQAKYNAHGKFFYHRLCGYMTSGPFHAMILSSPNAIKEWRSLIGPTHPVRARIHQPDTLRALYGLTDTRNSFHGSGKKKNKKKASESYYL